MSVHGDIPFLIQNFLRIGYATILIIRLSRLENAHHAKFLLARRQAKETMFCLGKRGTPRDAKREKDRQTTGYANFGATIR
jgi:hypothetical protein